MNHLWIKIGLPSCCLWLAACSGHTDFADKMQKAEVVTYHDRNGDGRVDLERHRFKGYADEDWELRDDDFNGTFESKWSYGIGLRKSAINLPVPKNVAISHE